MGMIGAGTAETIAASNAFNKAVHALRRIYICITKLIDIFGMPDFMIGF